jgi:hypothetical protein
VLTPGGNVQYDQLNHPTDLRLNAEKGKGELSSIQKPNAMQKTELAKITAATARHDAFLAKALVANDKGVVPFAVAARLAGVLDRGRKVFVST